MCHILQQEKWSNIIFDTQNIANAVFSMSDILICFAIVMIKGTNDCLQGISKLDYLIKASVFQVYKNRALNDPHKFSVDTTNTYQPFYQNIIAQTNL